MNTPDDIAREAESLGIVGNAPPPPPIHMDHPHPCSYPPNVLDRCGQCGTVFIRRDDGPLARGFCGESCEHEAKHPPPETAHEREARR